MPTFLSPTGRGGEQGHGRPVHVDGADRDGASPGLLVYGRSRAARASR